VLQQVNDINCFVWIWHENCLYIVEMVKMINQRRVKQTDDMLQAYFDQIKGIPLLTFEEELDLSRRIQKKDEGARRKLVEANLRLVIKIVRGYANSGAAFMDLIQEGNLGLIRAADKYSYVKNVRFSTYATWWIRQSINRFLASYRLIRLPHRKGEALRKIQQAYNHLSQRFMRGPTTEEIAREVGLSVQEAASIIGMSAGAGEDSSAVDLHEDYTYNPEQALLRKTSRDCAMRVLSQLKDREKRILIYRYQLNGGERYTLKRIGDKMGISPETVRQIEIRALKKIRQDASELRYAEGI
jgi:RNA polymerase primary sigma factor